MILTAEQKCLVWLSCAEVGAKQAQELIAACGGAEGIWTRFGTEDEPRFHPAIRAKLAALHSREAIDDICARLSKLNVGLIFRDDAQYPPMLNAIDDPPYLLYYAGRLACLARPCVAIVGTRTPSAYGRDVARTMARELCEAGVCVVSGLAFGIDEAAHMGAIDADGRTAGVMGSGINNPYPAEHRELLRMMASGNGLVLSEFPLDSEPLAYHFPHRNRIISGLSLGVVLVEGKVKSGGMRTVAAALSQGREVFAVPGRVGAAFSEGPHTILREGAGFVTCASDVLEDLGIQPPEPEPSAELPELSASQLKILNALEVEPMGAEGLSQALCIGADELIADIGTLEIMGLIIREAGNRFSRPVTVKLQRRG